MADGDAIAALDPGRSKCGLVRTDQDRQQLEVACILPPDACLAALSQWQSDGRLATVVLGNGTGAQSWQKQLQQLGLTVVLLDEWGTTLAARSRYWQQWPPRGWRRLLPEGLRLPPRDLDDVAAQILLERWLQRSLVRGPDTLGR